MRACRFRRPTCPFWATTSNGRFLATNDPETWWRTRRGDCDDLERFVGAQLTICGTQARRAPDGHRFLEGSANFVEQNGIDDWVGGVHLDSKAGNVWYFEEENHTLVHGVE